MYSLDSHDWTLLFKARAGPRGSTARIGVEHWCSTHSPAIKKATEVLQAGEGICDIDRISGAPQTLGDCSQPGPNRLSDVRRIHGFSPHFTVPAKDERAQVVRHALARLVHVDSGPVDVQVI